MAIVGGMRSPRFRHDPFIRDVALDPGKATAPRMTEPHMLPSTFSNSLGPCDFEPFVARSHTPDDHCVRFVTVVTFRNTTHSTLWCISAHTQLKG